MGSETVIITGATLGEPYVYMNTWGDLYTIGWAEDGTLYLGEDDSKGWNYPSDMKTQQTFCVGKVWGDDPGMQKEPASPF